MLISDYEDGGLRTVDIRSKTIALRVSWLRRLYTGTNHDWKKIPKTLISKKYPQGAFYPNVILKAPDHTPVFYSNIIKQWTDLAVCSPNIASVIQNQIIWNNRLIKIGNMTIKKVNKDLNFNFISDFYDENGQIMPWEMFKVTHDAPENYQFKWQQILHAIPNVWKVCIANNLEDFLASKHSMHEEHILFGARNIPLSELTSKMISIILIRNLKKKCPSEKTISEKLGIEIDWPNVHVHARHATIDMYTRMFHFKILHNVLYLNKNLFKMQLVSCPLCSFCKETEETVQHVFSECITVQNIWNDLQNLLRPETEIGPLDVTSAFLGPPSGTDTIVCHIHLIFKIFVYKSRDSGYCCFAHLKNKIKAIKDIEYNITHTDQKRREKNEKKWTKVAQKI